MPRSVSCRRSIALVLARKRHVQSLRLAPTNWAPAVGVKLENNLQYPQHIRTVRGDGYCFSA
jgi:hypothetical protein